MYNPDINNMEDHDEIFNVRLIKKWKVFYGQEPPSGESTTTECGVNYQLLAVIY